jgi:hypothetical protein
MRFLMVHFYKGDVQLFDSPQEKRDSILKGSVYLDIADTECQLCNCQSSEWTIEFTASIHLDPNNEFNHHNRRIAKVKPTDVVFILVTRPRRARSAVRNVYLRPVE